MVIVVSTENLKILKCHTFSTKILVSSIIYNKCRNEDEKIFEVEESIEISKSSYLKISKVWLKKM